MLVVKSCVKLLRSFGINRLVAVPTTLRSVYTANYLPLQTTNSQQSADNVPSQEQLNW